MLSKEELLKPRQYKNFLLIEVPEDATNFVQAVYDGLNIVWDKPDGWRGFIVLPDGGKYRIIGKANELKWQDWVSIVDKESDSSDSLNSWWYKDYVATSIMTKNPTKSGYSLLSSLNMKPETILIVEKIVNT